MTGQTRRCPVDSCLLVKQNPKKARLHWGIAVEITQINSENDDFHKWIQGFPPFLGTASCVVRKRCFGLLPQPETDPLYAFPRPFSAFFHRHGPLSAREERPIGGGFDPWPYLMGTSGLKHAPIPTFFLLIGGSKHV